MNKITAEHLQRNACVYVRQSTPDQLVHNLESQRRQYGLADRAKQLGWTTVEIIDDDLGRSGGGIVSVVTKSGNEHGTRQRIRIRPQLRSQREFILQ